jgi:tetratricopeptide (TPR) repeat protein
MNAQRIEMLKKALLEDPNDPFYLYALALEHIHTQRSDALKMLTSLLTHHPDYLPTYYQAGLLSIETGNESEGISILERGMVLAQLQKNQKALNELRALRDNV